MPLAEPDDNATGPLMIAIAEEIEAGNGPWRWPPTPPIRPGVYCRAYWNAVEEQYQPGIILSTTRESLTLDGLYPTELEATEAALDYAEFLHKRLHRP